MSRLSQGYTDGLISQPLDDILMSAGGLPLQIGDHLCSSRRINSLDTDSRDQSLGCCSGYLLLYEHIYMVVT